MNQSCIFVTGGCGYIGSHVTRQLTESGYKVIVIDNLSTGFPDALVHGETLIKGDLADTELLRRLFAQYEFSAVLHFAGSIVVPESVAQPELYYQNNTVNTFNLLKVCLEFSVKKFVFSSTASIYGDNKKGTKSEESDTPLPTNPYARSKLADEWILEDFSYAYGLKYVILRYFNVAGADPELRMGQRSPMATHLIKVACQKALGMRKDLLITGSDYNTPDGTGLRDYIHIEDLASAHLCALDYLQKGGASVLVNCGYGRGFSVREVIKVLEEVCGFSIGAKEAPRRPGDVASLIANVEKIGKILPQWKPKYADLKKIITSAYQWEEKLARPTPR
ncbi:MAG: UDP-glucose 4-epimerase GalE [Oligoflexales bacterium]|nr:UDP-glucose 4-epimerase GalE [Oligoflexales bacterium]